MSRRGGIVKSSNGFSSFPKMQFQPDFRPFHPWLAPICFSDSNRFGRSGDRLCFWPPAFLQKAGKHGAGARRKKPLDAVNAVSVGPNEHTVLISQNSLDDHT